MFLERFREKGYTMINHVQRLFFTVCFSVFLVLSIHAVANAGEPTEQLKLTIDSIISILKNKELKKPEKTDQRRAAIRKAVDKSFDFEEMARRSLALNWRQRTPEERKEFVSLFSDLIEKTYVRKIEKYEDEKVTYIDEKIEGEFAVVKTKILTKKDTEIPIDYKILKKNSRFEVYDIIIEGVSLVNNYRTQFNKIISSGSYEELVKKIKSKTVE